MTNPAEIKSSMQKVWQSVKEGKPGHAYVDAEEYQRYVDMALDIAKSKEVHTPADISKTTHKFW